MGGGQHTQRDPEVGGDHRGDPEAEAGVVEDYGYYSEGLKNSDIVWSEETLDAWLEDPGKIAPQSVMIIYGKVEDPPVRRKLIAFLKTEDPTINICPQ